MKILIALLAACTLTATPVAGSTWAPQTSPTTAVLHGVATSNGVTWVAVGNAGTILRSTDGGAGWSPVTSPVADDLNAVALRGPLGLAVGIGGRVLRSTDAGASWTEVARPTTKILFTAAIGDSFALLAGEEGRIFVSTDGGATWAPKFAGTASIFFGTAIAGDAAVSVGGQGAIAMSTFRGGGWGLTVLGTQLTAFYSTTMVTPTIGWAVGTTPGIASLVLRTDDGGFVWSGQTAPTSDILFGVSFLSTAVGTAVGANGVIIHTVDGGANWLAESSGVTETLNGVALAPAGVAVAVGTGGTILRSERVTGVGPLPGGPALALACATNPVAAASGGVRFALDLPADALVHLRVLSGAGRMVRALPDAALSAGRHAVTWDRADARGAAAVPGVYFLEARAGEQRAVCKFVLLR